MASATFFGKPFKIAGGVQVPMPSYDEQTTATLTLPVLIATAATYNEFQQAVSKVTVQRALGSKAGYVIVHNGPGAGTLSVPVGTANALKNFSAILTSFVARRFQNDAVWFCRADATWLILSEINPA